MPQYRVQAGQVLRIVVSRTDIVAEELRKYGFQAASIRNGVFGHAQGITLNQNWATEAPNVLGQLHPYDLALTGWTGSGTINKLVVDSEKLFDLFGIPPAPGMVPNTLGQADLESYAKALLARELVIFNVINKLTNAVEKKAIGLVSAESFSVNAGMLATATATITLAQPW